MYRTPFKQFKWERTVRKIKTNYKYFTSNKIFYNNEELPCLVLRVKKPSDFSSLKNLVDITYDNVICVFQSLDTDFSANFTFSIVQTNHKHIIEVIHEDIKEFSKSQVQPLKIYWLIPARLFKNWKISLNNYLFVKPKIL